MCFQPFCGAGSEHQQLRDRLGWVWKAASQNSTTLWNLFLKEKKHCGRTESSVLHCEALRVASGSSPGQTMVATSSFGAVSGAQPRARDWSPVLLGRHTKNKKTGMVKCPGHLSLWLSSGPHLACPRVTA